MTSLKNDWIDTAGKHEVNASHSSRSRYVEFIVLFGAIFTILQISDLMLTHQGLKNPEVKELNPFYSQEWFIPVKLTMVLLIMYTMSHMPENSHRLAKNTMAMMIFMYVFINLNNLYFLLAS
ncbi:MAG: DUF5658 family protein [Candidatus Methanoperedens sp.]|nr:DUF5658 family protein [Candidatus Methanoperedens sp.]